MKGKHHIIIETARLKYEFDIKRNITVIQGDSATGKTTLVDLLLAYASDKEGSGVRLESDVNCAVMIANSDNWQAILAAYDNQIVFIDEDASYIFSKEFAKAIQNTTNYYVLITRRPLTELPYSIKEIYGIRTSGKFHYPEQVYHEFYEIYSEETKESAQGGCRILTEDRKAGYQFFEEAFGKERCVSAEGNARLASYIDDHEDEALYAIADGAAFGAYITNTLAAAKQNGKVALFLPESFEWLVLKSGVIEIEDLDSILATPEDYIDSAEFLSWERFFTDLLRKGTENNPVCQYSKDKLKPFYYEGKNKERILSLIPGIEMLND